MSLDPKRNSLRQIMNRLLEKMGESGEFDSSNQIIKLHNVTENEFRSHKHLIEDEPNTRYAIDESDKSYTIKIFF